MVKIHKYPLSVNGGEQVVALPSNAVVFSVGLDAANQLSLWAAVDPNETNATPVVIEVLRSGVEINLDSPADFAAQYELMKTVQFGRDVFHVMKKTLKVCNIDLDVSLLNDY